MAKKVGPIWIDKQPMVLWQTEYDNGRVAYYIDTKKGEPFMTITVNLPAYDCPSDEFFVKTWSENALYIPQLLASGYFEVTGKTVPTGFVEAQIWRRLQ